MVNVEHVRTLQALRSGDRVLVNGEPGVFRRLSTDPKGGIFVMDSRERFVFPAELSGGWIRIDREKQDDE